MPGAARLGDKAQVDADAHGCPACPHPAIGPIVVGSPDVNINGKPAARQDDLGIHAVCCGPNNFTIVKGSPTVYVNGKPLARMNDKTKHCGGTGPITEGSPDVLIDDGAAAAQGLGSYAINALQIALQQAAKDKKKQPKQGSDTHQGTGPAKAKGDLAQTGKPKGEITAARWSRQRAKNGEEVELQVECNKDLKGSLTIEIWAQGDDPGLDKKVETLQGQAAKLVKKKVKVTVPRGAGSGNGCYFHFLVKDQQGGEKRSDSLFVERPGYRFSA